MLEPRGLARVERWSSRVRLTAILACVGLAAVVVSACDYTPDPLVVTPGTVASGPGVDKAQPFSAASIWNTPTPASTQWFDTTVLHAGAPLSNGDTFRHWWVSTDAVHIWWSSPTDPVWTFNMPAFVAPAWHRNRPAEIFSVQAPANLAASTDSDHILAVADPASGNYVEVWRASVNTATHTVTSTGPGWATGNMINGPGGGTLANNDGVRAANFSWMGGLITGADLAAGTIDHALVVSLPASMLMGGGYSGYQGGADAGTPAWRAPATGWETWMTGPIQMGSRLGIPADTPMPAGLSPLGVMVFNSLQTYGAFVGDYTGGQWPLFYADQGTVTQAQVQPLYAYWNYNGSSDMEKIGPLMRVADYQP
jgi:hypothetical protein